MQSRDQPQTESFLKGGIERTLGTRIQYLQTSSVASKNNSGPGDLTNTFSSIQNSGSPNGGSWIPHNRDVIGRNRWNRGWMVSYGNVVEVTVDRPIVKPIQ